VTAPPLNGLLMPLEKKGLIERRPDPENARVLRCYLKPKGKQLLERGMGEARAVFELMLGKLTSHERAEFRRILHRCIEALQSGAAETERTARVHSLRRIDERGSKS
jgi:DNA-binding MarR family transcriptional regulator